MQRLLQPCHRPLLVQRLVCTLASFACDDALRPPVLSCVPRPDGAPASVMRRASAFNACAAVGLGEPSECSPRQRAVSSYESRDFNLLAALARTTATFWTMPVASKTPNDAMSFSHRDILWFDTPNQVSSDRLMYYRLVGIPSYRSMFLIIVAVQVSSFADKHCTFLRAISRYRRSETIKFSLNKKVRSHGKGWE
jgi:hypothetical protein